MTMKLFLIEWQCEDPGEGSSAGMSIKKKEMPWYQREYEEMLHERQRQPGYQPARNITSDWPKPKLSEVLECARLAKQQPEIWELAKEQAKIPPEDWHHDMDHLMPSMTGPFYKLFMYKNGLEDHLPFAFMTIGRILREWTKSDFNGDEVAVVRAELRPPEYIDDLADNDGNNS